MHGTRRKGERPRLTDLCAGLLAIALLGLAAVPTAGAIEPLSRSILARHQSFFQAKASTSSPPDIGYLRRHCPIVVSVNIGAGAGHLTGKKSGVALQGKAIDRTTAQEPHAPPLMKYNWQISKQDQFCGIVGISYGPKYHSLVPTLNTARHGEYAYIEPSFTYRGLPGEMEELEQWTVRQIQEFQVYARPRATPAR
jgi:hypothetical protein